MTRSELAALSGIPIEAVNAGPRFGPPAQPGWLIAVNAAGEPVMSAATTGKGSRYAMGLVLLNARGNGYELRRAVAGVAL